MSTEGGQSRHRVASSPVTCRIGDDDVIIRDFLAGDEAQVVEVYTRAFGSFYPADKPVDPQAFVRWLTEHHDSHEGRFIVADIGGRSSRSNACALCKEPSLMSTKVSRPGGSPGEDKA